MIYLINKDGGKYTGSADLTGPLEKLVNGIQIPLNITLQKNKNKKKTTIHDVNMNEIEVEVDYYAYRGTFVIQGLTQYREGTFYHLPDVKNVGNVLNSDDWETVGENKSTIDKETPAPEQKEETPEEIEEREFQEFKKWKAMNKA